MQSSQATLVLRLHPRLVLWVGAKSGAIEAPRSTNTEHQGDFGFAIADFGLEGRPHWTEAPCGFAWEIAPLIPCS